MQAYSASHTWSEGVCLFNSSLWLWFPDTYCTAEPRRSLEVAELRNKNNIAEGDNANNRNFNDSSNKNGRIPRICRLEQKLSGSISGANGTRTAVYDQ